MQFSGITITGGFNVAPSAPAVPTDAYWANVSFLSETTSTDAQTNNTFLDSSTNTFTITRIGSTTQGSYSPFPANSTTSYSPTTNGGSGFFDGSTSYLTLPSNVAFTFGTGDFTVETWVYLTNVSGSKFILDMRPEGTDGVYPVLYIAGAAVNWYINTSTVLTGTVSATTWTHIAVSRSSGVSKMFINGVQAGSSYSDSNNYLSGAPAIGSARYNSGQGLLNGYLSSTRIVKGTAVYTTTFTPSTTPLTAISGTSLLMNYTNAGMYDARAISNLTGFGTAQASTTQAKWAPTSAYFNGSSSLSAPSSILFGYGTNDFTIEFWVYLNALGDQTMVSNLATIPSVAPHIYYSVGGNLIYYTNSGIRITGSALTTGTWYYIALSRASGSTKMFINGTQTGSTYTDTNNYGSANPLGIGDYPNPVSVSRLNGYIQDLRITKGVARYTTTFTPPTAALPTNG